LSIFPRLGEEQEALLFRENSIGSKSIESFLKLVCRNYLNESLQDVVKTVIDTSEEVDCEVDKERIVATGDLKTNRDQLTRTAYTTVCRILTKREFFPNELREVYVSS
jgi:ketosteroid isomerase-like protein